MHILLTQFITNLLSLQARLHTESAEQIDILSTQLSLHRQTPPE